MCDTLNSRQQEYKCILRNPRWPFFCAALSPVLIERQASIKEHLHRTRKGRSAGDAVTGEWRRVVANRRDPPPSPPGKSRAGSRAGAEGTPPPPPPQQPQHPRSGGAPRATVVEPEAAIKRGGHPMTPESLKTHVMIISIKYYSKCRTKIWLSLWSLFSFGLISWRFTKI